jgi:hypothetical protein
MGRNPRDDKLDALICAQMAITRKKGLSLRWPGGDKHLLYVASNVVAAK